MDSVNSQRTDLPTSTTCGARSGPTFLIGRETGASAIFDRGESLAAFRVFGVASDDVATRTMQSGLLSGVRSLFRGAYGRLPNHGVRHGGRMTSLVANERN